MSVKITFVVHETPPIDKAGGYTTTGPRYWIGESRFVQRISLPGRPWGRFARKIVVPSEWYLSCYDTRREALNGSPIHNTGVAFVLLEDQQAYRQAFALLTGGGSNAEYMAWNSRRWERYRVKHKRTRPMLWNDHLTFKTELEDEITRQGKRP